MPKGKPNILVIWGDDIEATFEDFPPVQRPGSFTIDDAMAKMAVAAAGG